MTPLFIARRDQQKGNIPGWDAVYAKFDALPYDVAIPPKLAAKIVSSQNPAEVIYFLMKQAVEAFEQAGRMIR